MSAPILVNEVTVNDDVFECRFFPPVMIENNFICCYEIDWPDNPITGHAAGVDQAEALASATRKVHVEMLFAQADMKLHVEPSKQKPRRGYKRLQTG